ncbi:MAG: HD domain-containing protein [Candidatus Absconditabacteria bacterium]
MLLTIETAKQIAIENAKKIQDPQVREFTLIHSEKVGLIANLIGKKLGLKTDLFLIAGRVHDIGYSVDFDNHALLGVQMLQVAGYEVDELLKDCILNHGTHGNPKYYEGKIFQIADKLSIFDFDVVQVLLKYNDFPLKGEPIEFLKKMSNNALELIKKF